MKKRIGILTQPLHNNYGGLLQAYALKTTLEKLGHEVEIVNRRRDTVSIKYLLKRFIKRILGKGPRFELTKYQASVISKNTDYFTRTYIKDITPPVYSTASLRRIAANYDAYVVGSDQVWRPRYSPEISNYYLDFVDDSNTVGIAYAASFGVDRWEYSDKETRLCRENIHKFKAISVREDSGVKLCEVHLGDRAIHVIDPTMLLKKEDYVNLLGKENENPDPGNLLCYILDAQQHKDHLINEVSLILELEPFFVNPKKKAEAGIVGNIEDYVFPTVTSWLNGFHMSNFVITDSFHGAVFSIIFNKPFLVLANVKRGKARFESLLKMFHLEDRLFTDAHAIDADEIRRMKFIEWSLVNTILAEKREFAMNFLRTNI